MIGYIYQLVCPKLNLPIYVGLTECGTSQRLKEHIRDSKKPKSPVHRYINENNIQPSIEQIEVVEYSDRKELRDREKYWIGKLSNSGIRLMNKILYANLGWEGAIFVRVPKGANTYSELKKLSEDTGESMNTISIRAIEEYLKKHKVK